MVDGAQYELSMFCEAFGPLLCPMENPKKTSVVKTLIRHPIRWTWNDKFPGIGHAARTPPMQVFHEDRNGLP